MDESNGTLSAVELCNPIPEEQFESEFLKPCVSLGGATMAIGFFASFLPAIVLFFLYGAIPSLSQMAVIIGLVASASLAWWIVEPISYFPVLGTAGSYMAFMCGGVKDVRLPCAIAAQEATNAEPGTQKGELMATMGIAGSVVTNLIFVTLGALGGTLLLGVLPDAAKNAFQYVPNAIYGTMFTTFLIKRPDLAAFGVLMTLFLVKIGVLFIPPFLLMLLNVALCVALAILLYKKLGRK